MREYEAMIILSPDLDDSGVNEIVGQVGTLVSREGGEVTLAGQLTGKKGHIIEATEGWRVRRLAYSIGGRKEGYYVVLRFSTQPSVLAELEHRLKLNENVLRHLVLHAKEGVTRLAEKK